MTTNTPKPLSFESADAVTTGGSYTVNSDGKLVRNDAISGPLEPVAPGQSTDTVGVSADGKTGVELAPAHSDATAKKAIKTA